MVSRIVFIIATGIGLMTDKYMLEATNFVEHYQEDTSADEAGDCKMRLVKCAMYVGAIAGMVTFGPLSDIAGRRACLLACSVITLIGALLSTFAWSVEILILGRILAGIGMGGEYPLAAAHSAESAETSADGARDVALLYLFGAGGGPVLCDLVTYLLDVSGMPDRLIWRAIFAVGSALSLAGLVLRFLTTENSKKFVRAATAAKGTRRSFLRHYWRPVLGTAVIWMLFDVVEYGLKQNDAAIFAAEAEGPYRDSVLTVLLTRLLVIPSLALAPWLLTKLRSKWVQAIGFAGCMLVNLVLALWYAELRGSALFAGLYIAQLSLQSLPGVTTMAIPAEIFPSAVRGTGAAISTASGKVGATLGSFFFTMMQEQGNVSGIFWVVSATSAAALVLTLCLTPLYSGETLDQAELLAERGQTRAACKMLYSGPRDCGSAAAAVTELTQESTTKDSAKGCSTAGCAVESA